METKRQQKFGRQIQKDLSDIFQKEFKEIFGKGNIFDIYYLIYINIPNINNLLPVSIFKILIIDSVLPFIKLIKMDVKTFIRTAIALIWK